MIFNSIQLWQWHKLHIWFNIKMYLTFVPWANCIQLKIFNHTQLQQCSYPTQKFSFLLRSYVFLRKMLNFISCFKFKKNFCFYKYFSILSRIHHKVFSFYIQDKVIQYKLSRYHHVHVHIRPTFYHWIYFIRYPLWNNSYIFRSSLKWLQLHVKITGSHTKEQDM